MALCVRSDKGDGGYVVGRQDTYLLLHHLSGSICIDKCKPKSNFSQTLITLTGLEFSIRYGESAVSTVYATCGKTLVFSINEHLPLYGNTGRNIHLRYSTFKQVLRNTHLNIIDINHNHTLVCLAANCQAYGLGSAIIPHYTVWSVTASTYHCTAVKVPCRCCSRCITHIGYQCVITQAHQCGSVNHITVYRYCHRLRKLTCAVPQVNGLNLYLIITGRQC